ncbi:YbhN family protein [Rhizobium sp. BG6]|uniref:lysylphosphatidylglycerol synthase transmembrane domain-containing protein n=1 Tax=Rhizobium sp. BG6 TaxID=2613771 RepID=UPI001FEEB276|nr:YbhN family protein [Rhizobium sp. BG6]
MSAKKLLINAVLLLGLALAAYLLYRVFSRYSFAEITASVEGLPASRLSAGFAFAAMSYLCLTVFDWMGLRYAGRPLSYPKAALASFTGLSIGHSLGFAALSSGAVRYRYYSRWGSAVKRLHALSSSAAQQSGSVSRHSAELSSSPIHMPPRRSSGCQRPAWLRLALVVWQRSEAICC